MNGRKIRESAGNATKTEAEALLKRRIREAVRGTLDLDLRKVTFSTLEQALHAEYARKGNKSTDRLEYSIRHLKGFFFPFDSMADITYGDIEAYRLGRMKEGAASGTVNRELSALSMGFKALRKSYKGLQPPVIEMGSENRRTRTYLRPDDFKRLVKHLDAQVGALVTFAYLTGWRCRAEAQTLEWTDVNWDHGTLMLRAVHSKNGRARTFSFREFPELREVIEGRRDYTLQVEEDLGLESGSIRWVFHRRGKRIAVFRKPWDKACQATSMPQLMVHDLRGSAAVNMLNRGVPEVRVKELCGWETGYVFERYTRYLDNEAHHREVGKMAGILG